MVVLLINNYGFGDWEGDDGKHGLEERGGLGSWVKRKKENRCRSHEAIEHTR